MSTNDKNTLSVEINPDEAKIMFLDLLEVEATPDAVILSIIQRLPGSNENERKARLLARYALSWPHFGRIVKLFNHILENEKEKVANYFNDNLIAIKEQRE